MKIVIFAGGAGTRLWPLSRKNSPKQFGKLIGEKSTIQQTVDRLLPAIDASDIYIATGKQYAHIVHEQLGMIPKENFLFEPAMRDVGPAIGMVASILEKKFGDEPIAIIWSDHMVKQEELFCKILLMAGDKVAKKENSFMFIAQKPRFANQNMGWIEVGKEIAVQDGVRLFNFSRLRYRPTLQEAEQFFHNQNFVWNLGYFVTTPSFLTSLFAEFAPEMFEQLKQIADAYGSNEFESVCEAIYPAIERISFDDAILTKLNPDGVGVFSADLEWSDIGAWESLKEALTDYEHQNVVRGNVLVEDCRDSIVFNESKQLIVGIDLDGFVVINTEDVVLVCPKNAVPKIKKIVESLSGTPHENLA